MSTTTPQPLAEVAVGKIPFSGKLQSLLYAGVLGQWAVGFWSGLYVLVLQAKYFGLSLKYGWDHLDTILHFGAVPGIGHWLVANYDLGRHIFLRDSPESVLAYSVVAMVIPVLITKVRDTPPLLDRIMVRLGMPSPYQGMMGRHKDTSGLQYLFLIPSMILASWPGEILAAVAIFGGMALAHKWGYSSQWLTPESPWIAPVIGIAGGKLAGHKPAVKAGQDIQGYFLSKRRACAYLAERILDRFYEGEVDRDEARDKLTAMPRTAPPWWYPAPYRLRYRKLLKDRAPVREYGSWRKFAIGFAVAAFIVVGAWGVYLRKYGIEHGFWMP